MKQWILGLSLLLVVGGCAGLKQAKSDYSVGKSTPLAANETAPSDIAKSLIEPVVPFIPTPFQPVAGLLTVVATAFFTWKRGRNLRLGKTPTVTPNTSWLTGTATAIKDAFAGLYEVGPDGSPVKRSWKTLVSVALGLIGAAITVPAAKVAILAHPDIVGLVTLLSASLSGIEKELSNQPPA